MGFYRNTGTQQDSELYELSKKISLTATQNIIERCEQEKLGSVKLQRIFLKYRDVVDNTDNYLSIGIPSDLNRELLIGGYNFDHVFTDKLTDYIYNHYLNFVLEYKSNHELFNLLMISVRIGFTGYPPYYSMSLYMGGTIPPSKSCLPKECSLEIYGVYNNVGAAYVDKLYIPVSAQYELPY